MSRLAETASMNVRRTQQRRVAALLDEIAARRQRLYVLKAYGVRKAGMRLAQSRAERSPRRTRRGHQRSDDPADAARRTSVARHLAPVGQFGVARRRFGAVEPREPANLGRTPT